MMQPAFSTVACPEWPVETVLERAVRYGFVSVELRTFGDDSRGFASDPALTAPEKIRTLTDRFGIGVAQLATSHAFGDAINPPVIGLVISDTEKAVRAAKRAIDLAAMVECPLVRVFGFDLPPSEKRGSAVARVVDRLGKVIDHAHRTGVRVALENGGSFCRAAEVAEVLDAIRNPLLGACLNVAVAHAAGDAPDAAVNVLEGRIFSVRVKDLREGQPCPLGQGTVPNEVALRALAARGWSGPVVFEWDRAWRPALEAPDLTLPRAAQTLFGWIGGDAATPRHAAQRAGA